MVGYSHPPKLVTIFQNLKSAARTFKIHCQSDHDGASDGIDWALLSCGPLGILEGLKRGIVLDRRSFEAIFDVADKLAVPGRFRCFQSTLCAVNLVPRCAPLLIRPGVQYCHLILLLCAKHIGGGKRSAIGVRSKLETETLPPIAVH